MCIPLFSIFLTDVDFPVHSTFKSEKVSTHIESREIVNIYKDNIFFMYQFKCHNNAQYFVLLMNKYKLLNFLSYFSCCDHFSEGTLKQGCSRLN